MMMMTQEINDKVTCVPADKNGGETQGDKDAGVAEGWDGTQQDGTVSAKNSTT